MKTKLFYVIISVLMLFLFGCSKDKSPTESESDMALVGTWKLIEMRWISLNDTTTTTESQLNDMGMFDIAEYYDDGTCKGTTNMSGSGELETYSGTWTTVGNQLVLNYTSPAVEQIIYEYTIISEDILNLKRSSPSGDETVSLDYRKQ